MPRATPGRHGRHGTATRQPGRPSPTRAPSEGGGHSHSHGSLRLTARSPVVARALTIAAAVCLLATVVGAIALWPRGDAPEAPGVTPGTVYVDATVTRVLPTKCAETNDPAITCSIVRFQVTSGPTSGRAGQLTTSSSSIGIPELEAGDKVRLSYFADAPEGLEYRYVDLQRRSSLAVLAIVFVAAVLLLSRAQGLRSLLGMVMSLVVLVVFLLPALLRAGPPLPLALVAAAAIAFLALYLSHGVHLGTTVALLGSIGALIVTTVLGAVFISATNLTGLTDENATSLLVASGEIDLRGLILAGVVIGALGVLDDVTVTQVSAVAEIQAADPTLEGVALWRAGLRVGKDHIASTVNTLVLAYAGASLPLLLLFSQGGRSFTDVLTSELVAVELVRALVGSIGLVAAVPITTGLAVLAASAGDTFDWPRRSDDPGHPDDPGDRRSVESVLARHEAESADPWRAWEGPPDPR